MSQFSQTTDVVCAGGGPAGLTAAIALRLRGFRVIVADALVPPVDKACGEGLMPDGVAALRAFGIVPEQHEHAIFHGIRFLGPECSVEAHFPSGRGIGMRRTVLHEALRRRAADLGVEMNWGARVTGIAPGAAFVDHRPMNAKWIIGADGQDSRIREWSGLSPSSRKRSRKFRIGLRRHFRVQRWTDLVEVYWCNSGQAYVTPVAEDELCVAVVSRNRHVDFDGLINQCPQLAQKLRNAVPLDQIRGSATATRKPRWGLGLADVTPEIRQQVQVPGNVHGAVIERVVPGSSADNAGLQQGDVITEVNRHPVQSAAEVQRELANVEKGQDALVLVWSNGGTTFRVLHPTQG